MTIFKVSIQLYFSSNNRASRLHDVVAMFGANGVVTDLRGVTGRQGRTERCLVLEIGNGGQDGGEAVVRA